jgi:hypothetical protein
MNGVYLLHIAFFRKKEKVCLFEVLERTRYTKFALLAPTGREEKKDEQKV